MHGNPFWIWSHLYSHIYDQINIYRPSLNRWLPQHVWLCRRASFNVQSGEFIYGKRHRLASHLENCPHGKQLFSEFFESLINFGSKDTIMLKEVHYSHFCASSLMVTMETIRIFIQLAFICVHSLLLQSVHFHHLNGDKLMEFRSPHCQEY